ncbi:MAG: hypothetical protein WCJ72_09355 [Chryseobacterium sp.]
MSSLPSTLWGAVNRAKLDLRKYHLEENPKKKEQLKQKAVLAIDNADKVVGPGPHKFMSSRHGWRNEVLYINSYEEDARVGRYWQDTVAQWSLEFIPEWATNKDLKVQEPTVGAKCTVNGIELVYSVRPMQQDR